MADDKTTFKIGLAMAGAISAGAYSAGVTDFLFEALDEWYKVKGSNPNDYPTHDVVLKVISGASAGSITAALAGFATRFANTPKVPAGAVTAAYTIKTMYDAWVVNVDFLPKGQGAGLLSTSDLTPKSTVTSLLNSKALVGIGNIAFGYAPTPCTLRKVPYIAERLHVYLMVTNLRGVPYEVLFGGPGSGSGYGMVNHGDRVHYVITNLGTATLLNAWADKDQPVELDVMLLPGGPVVPGHSWPAGPWTQCLDAALASSAFPLGFSPVTLKNDYRDYDPRQWPFEHSTAKPLDPNWPSTYKGDPGAEPIYSFACVDGGVINNEPFEYAHYALQPPGAAPNNRTASGADSAVVMIDPFPELPNFTVRNKQKTDLISVLTNMFLDLKDQARFKPSELADAVDDTCYSRFLIGPRRYVSLPLLPGQPIPGPYATANGIACGLLGGFGGFLSQLLRDHDYQLGRRNCYDFLRTWFVLAGNNPIFANWPAAAVANPAFRPKGEPADGERCIIPLVGTCCTQPELLKWPQVGDAVIDKAIAALTNRAEVLFPLFRSGLRGRFARWAAGLVWMLGVKSYLLKYAEWKVKADLTKRGNYDQFQPGSVAEFNVLGLLADPAYDYYTEAYIGETINVLDASVVTQILEKHRRLGTVVYDGDLKGWTLAAREPSVWQKIRDKIAIGDPTVAKADS